ncbi:hypothetical protein, partial [Pseudoalteromonas sp. S326]|uniref:hypothetical protein n=1 Tax=Pseudoalteromonas sp. S326 TaxID=579533 RepID=UPI0020163091
CGIRCGRLAYWMVGHVCEGIFSYLELIGAANGQPISFDAVKGNNSFEITEDTFSFYTEFDFEAELSGMPL